MAEWPWRRLTSNHPWAHRIRCFQSAEVHRRELATDQARVVDDACPHPHRADGRVDVLGQELRAKAGFAQKLGAPVAVRAAEDAEVVQSLAPRVTDGVDLLELDRDKAGDARLVAVAHDAVPLHDVGAVGEPAPRPLEGSDHRVVVGVEDSHELAGHDGQCRVDVVGLRSAVGDP